MSKTRFLPALTGAGVLALAAGAALAAEDIAITGAVAPESITSDAAGNIYIGSMAQGAVMRVAAGSDTPEPWIESHSDSLLNVFGVFADDASGTLFVCSGTLSFGPGAAGAEAQPSSLYAFDLASGDFEAAHEFPTEGSACNDVAVGADGSVYATDTQNMEVVRLAPGADALEVWAGDGAFGPAGGVLDGIAMVDGRVVVNTLATSKLFAVEVAGDGSAGAVTELTQDRAIERPDGMRSIGGGAMLAVEGGRLSRIAVDGDQAHVTTVEEGFAGPVSVTVVDGTAYVLEGQFAALQAGPDDDVPPTRAAAVALDD